MFTFYFKLELLKENTSLAKALAILFILTMKFQSADLFCYDKYFEVVMFLFKSGKMFS
mgnify:CR=1 FL=1